MTNQLEETLRDELAARVHDLPHRPDIADIVINRAGRIRRRQRFTVSACACLLVLTGVTWFSAATFDTTGDKGADAVADAADELGVFSVLSTDGDILTGTGELFDTDFAVAESAMEVHGGWVVTGAVTEGAAQTVRYVSFTGDTTDLGSGEVATVHSSERGDSVVVETYSEANAEAQGSVFTVTTDSKVLAQGEFEVPSGTTVGGMAGSTVWLEPSNTVQSDENTAPNDMLFLWSERNGTTAPVRESGMPVGSRLVASIEGGQALAVVPGGTPEDLCLSTVMVGGSYVQERAVACFSDLSLLDVVVSPDGEQIMGYVQPTKPTQEDPGEWVWLPMNGDTAMQSTGFVDYETRPFFTYRDVVFHDPEGNWYGQGGEELGIPPLGGEPIAIKHVPR